MDAISTGQRPIVQRIFYGELFYINRHWMEAEENIPPG
jgi:hypothetical protein